MRLDFSDNGRFLRSERSGSGGRWGFPRPPEKMAEHGKSVRRYGYYGALCAPEMWEQTRIHFGFVTFFWSASGERARRKGRETMQSISYDMRTLLPALSGGRANASALAWSAEEIQKALQS